MIFDETIITQWAGGVKHLMQVPEFLTKAQKSRMQNKYQTKDYVFPSGRVEIIQGYEDIAIDELLETHHEDDLVIDDDKTPVIYYEFEGKTHRYFCDIWIPKTNQVVEVKSNYTWEIDLGRNKAKEKATIASGFDFRLMKYD